MVGSSASLKTVAARKFLGKLRHVFAGIGPGGKVGSVRDNTVRFPNGLVRKIPGIARLGPTGRYGVWYMEFSKKNAPPSQRLANSRSARVAGRILFVLNSRIVRASRYQGGVLECVSPDLFLELVG